MSGRQAVTLELDADVVARLRERAEHEHVSEAELVERALRTANFRALLDRIRERSDLDDDAATQFAVEAVREARSEHGSRAA